MSFRTQRHAETLREELLRKARAKRLFDEEQGEVLDQHEQQPGAWGWAGMRISRLFRQREEVAVAEVQPDSIPVEHQAPTQPMEYPHFDMPPPSRHTVPLTAEERVQYPVPPGLSSSIYESTPRIDSPSHFTPANVPLGPRPPPPVQPHLFGSVHVPYKHPALWEDDEEQRRRMRRENRLRQKESVQSGSHRKRKKKHPRHFLCCIPWVKSRRARALITQSVVFGLFFLCLLVTYIGLAASHLIRGKGLTAILIVTTIVPIVLMTISLVKLCLVLRRRGKSKRRPRHSDIGIINGKGYTMPPQPTPTRIIHREYPRPDERRTEQWPPAYGPGLDNGRVDPRSVPQQENQASKPVGIEEVDVDISPQSSPGPPSYLYEHGISQEHDAVPISPLTSVGSPEPRQRI